MTDQSSAPPLPLGTNLRLSVMMFLQYAIWGAWLPLLWGFLSNHRGMSAGEIGDMFAIGAVGAIVAPFVAGQVADRYFNTEKFLAISHLLGAVVIWQLAEIESYGGFLGFSLVYSLVYSPTLPLTNSLAFHHIPDRDRDFGKVRTWGTVGWIFGGIAIGQWLLMKHTPSQEAFEAARTAGSTSAETFAAFKEAAWDAGKADAFRLSAILGVLMAAFSFLALPKTPPARSETNNATLEAFSEIKRQPLLMLFLLAVPVSCIHQFYFVHTATFLGEIQANSKSEFMAWLTQVFGAGGGGVMTIGQIAEVLVLALVPFFAKRVTRKTLLAAGLVAYAARMALFAYCPDSVPLVVLGVALHGMCFGCFIFVSFMVVDEETDIDIRASAQSLYNLVIIGVGTIVGSYIATSVQSWYSSDGTTDYTGLFSVPMYASLACLALLFVGYPKKSPARAA